MNDTLDEATAQIAMLREQQAHLFDPVRFRFIEVMVEKMQRPRTDGALALLNDKVLQAITNYQKDLFAEEKMARQMFSDFQTEHSDQLSREHLDIAKGYLEQYQFRKLSQWLQRLGRQLSAGKGIKGLPSLLGQHPAIVEKNLQQLSFDDFLREQENNLLQSLGESDGSGPTLGASSFSELKSLTLFRDSWVKLNTDKLVTQAIKEAPENAGPLNSHRLVIRSLSAIRELSPAYMNRFVSYLDTLLWLEKVGEDAGFLLDKKSGAKLKPGGRR